MITAEELAPRLLDAGEAEEAWRRFHLLDPQVRSEVVRLMKARVEELMRNEPPAALAPADALVRAARSVPGDLPLALRGRAGVLHYNARFEAAREDYETALALCTDTGDELGAARIRRNLIDVYQFLGAADTALECADDARDVFRRHGEVPELAKIENNVGNVYTRLDEYPKARTHYQAARDAFEELGDELGLGIASFNLGVVEMNANECDAAEHCFESARATFERANMGLHVADCDYSLAYLASRVGRFTDAIRGLERARELYQANGKPSGPPLCDLDLAEIFLRLDARRNAAEYAARAAAGFEELGLEYELARCEILAGLALVKLGSNVQAIEHLERSSERFRRLGNQASAAAVEVQRAAIEVEEGTHDQAIARLRSARDELGARELRFLTDLAGVTLARAHLSHGESGVAREILERLLEESRGRAAFDLLLKSDALGLLAQARRATGDSEAAIDALRGSVAATERNYAEIPSSDVRVAFFRERHMAYVDLVWDLAERGDEAGRREALEVLEQSRARSLNEAGAARGRSSEAFRRARERLDWLLGRHLDAEFGPTAGDHDLRKHSLDDAAIRAAQDEVLELARALEPELPTGAARAPRLDPAALRAARGDGDVLCLYLTSDRGVRVFVVDETGVHDRKLDVDERRLRTLRDRLWLHVDKLRLGKAYLKRHRERLDRSIQPILARLGRALVEPIRDLVGGRAMVVVPFGVLHDLPFHALFVDGAPLLLTNEVSYGLSVTSLARSRERAWDPRSDVVACGVQSGSLAHIEDELDDLRGIFGEALRRLTPAELLEELESRAATGGLLHLAAHSVYQPRRPVFSAVCLGDRFLLAHDVARLRMSFDLVVLSGCETGRKRRIPGEEFFGLSSSLVAAGAQSVLGSLWAVEDADARAFMGDFYRELASGRGVRTAVAEAQRRQFAAGLPPTTWGSFALMGAPDTRIPVPHQFAPQSEVSP